MLRRIIFLNCSAIFYNNVQKTKKLNMLSIQHLSRYLYHTESGTLLTLHNSQGRSSVPPQDCINEFIIRRLNLSVIVDCTPAYVMNSDFTPEVVMKFLPAQFSRMWCKCQQNNFIHSKIFQSDRIQRSYHKKFTAYYTCRNADLNLRLVAATTTCNGFIFDIINS